MLCCSICHIKETPFASQSREKQMSIFNQRPCPELSMPTTSKVKNFQASWYDKKDWLCGCVSANKLFYFPCLLFSCKSKASSSWTVNGFKTFKKFSLIRNITKTVQSIYIATNHGRRSIKRSLLMQLSVKFVQRNYSSEHLATFKMI